MQCNSKAPRQNSNALSWAYCCMFYAVLETPARSGMQNVNGGRCAGPDCSKQPRFSLPGEKGKYCSKHRGEGMVDVLYTVSVAIF